MFCRLASTCVFLICASCLAFPASEQDAQLQALEQTLLKQRKQYSSSQVELAKLSDQLKREETLLISIEGQMVAAFDRAEGNATDQDVQAATNMAMRFNRQDALVQSLRKQQKQLQKDIANMQVSLPALEQKYQAEMGSVAALGRSSSSAETSSAVVQAVDDFSNWPYLNQATAVQKVQARNTLNVLLDQQAAGKQGRAPLKRVDIQARKSFGKTEMTYIGESLYSAVAEVKAGHQAFVLFNKEYWHNIPEGDDDAEYRFIFDVSSLSQPVLYLFSNELIKE